MSKHSELTGAELHQFVNYWQETDPGAVGYKKTWFKESTRAFVYRNSDNDGWLPVLGASTEASLPPGSDWDDVLDAIEAAADGSIVVLPNEKIIQTSGVQLGDKNLTIAGSGPFSEIQCEQDISFQGSGVQIVIENDDNDQLYTVTLQNFIISQDRPGMSRCACVTVRGGNKAVNLIGMRFNDCTANVIQVLVNTGDDISTHLGALNIIGCIATEWYEGFVWGPHALTSVDNINIINNTGTTTSGSPNGSASRPQFVLLANETTLRPSAVHSLTIAHNTFVGDLVGAGDFANSTGIALKVGTGSPQLLENVYIHGNHVEGFQINEMQVYHAAGSSNPGGVEGRCLINIVRNKFISDHATRTFWLRIAQTALNAKDRIFFSDNDLCKSTGAGNLVVDDAGTFGTDILINGNPPNKLYQLPFAAVTSDITESFTTANGDTLGPDLTWTEVAGDFDIVSNKAKLITLASDSRARAEEDLGSADHYVACVVNQDAVADTDLAYSKIGVIARWNGADSDYYQAFINYRYRRVALLTKSGLQIAGAYVHSLVANTPVKLSLRCVGTLIAVFLDDQPVIVEVDGNVTTGNYTGIMGFDSTGSTRVLTYSAFEAGAV